MSEERDSLDPYLRALVDGEPSADFRARVLERLEPTTARHRVPTRVRAALAASAAIAAVLLGATVAVRFISPPRGETPDRREARVARSASPPASPVGPGTEQPFLEQPTISPASAPRPAAPSPRVRRYLPGPSGTLAQGPPPVVIEPMELPELSGVAPIEIPEVEIAQLSLPPIAIEALEVGAFEGPLR